MTMNTNLATLDLASPPLGSLESYISWVHRLPILNAEEENKLAANFHTNGDLSAARQLVLANLRFVVRIAYGYNGYGLSQGDLIQEGNIGLMKAIKRFNPAMGVRLISFAVHWIKAEINEFVLRNWRIVKVATTKAQRKLFFNLRKNTKKLDWFNDKEVKQIAQDLKVKPQEVRIMESRLLGGGDVAFNVRNDETEDGSYVNDAEDYLADDSHNPAFVLTESNWTSDRTGKLVNALAQLDKRSKDILEQRWMQEQKATLHELARKYKISAERVRQLEQQALLQLKQLLV